MGALTDELIIPYEFENLLFLVTAELEKICSKWLEKVETVFRDLVSECIPKNLDKFYQFKNKLLRITYRIVNNCLEEIRKEIEYDLALSGNYVNFSNEFVVEKLPEKPSVQDYLSAYIEVYNEHIVDFIWKLIMVCLIKVIKEDLRESLNIEFYRYKEKELKSLLENDPSEVLRIKALKKTLNDIREVMDELMMINF